MPHSLSSRRRFMHRSALAGAAVLLPGQGHSDHHELAVAVMALRESPLIYLSPYRSDGTLSRCQSELWFYAEGTTVFVVTARKAWRARAVAQGLHRARVWVGDVGVWRRSDGAYRELPHFDAVAGSLDDPVLQNEILPRFAQKYAGDGWRRWDDRWRQGLADGSRVMLQYQAQSL